jgi:signal peptidase I
MPMTRHPLRSGSTHWRLLALLIALLGVFGLFPLRQRFQLTLVLGYSMRPTLRTGDLLLVDRSAYASAQPQRGETVIVRVDHHFMVKRVVGLPGEEIEVAEGTVFVNGCALTEEHGIIPGSLSIAKGRLAPGKYAVLGDNRSAWPTRGVHAILRKDEMLGRARLFAHLLPKQRLSAISCWF